MRRIYLNLCILHMLQDPLSVLYKGTEIKTHTILQNTVKPQWPEHLLVYENLFEKWVVRATEG